MKKLVSLILVLLTVFSLVACQKSSEEKPNNLFSHGLVPYRVGMLWGFMDQNGQAAIAPAYQMVWSFASNGLAAVCTGEKWGFINTKGEMVIQPQYDLTVGFCEDGFAIVRLNDECCAVINEKNEVIASAYHINAGTGGFGSVGLLPGAERTIQKNEDGTEEYVRRWGYLDRKGRWAIQPQFDYANAFSDTGFARVEIDGKYGYIDKKGTLVIPAEYEIATDFTEDGRAVVGVRNDSGDLKYGYIDEEGTMVIAPIYDDAYPFASNGRAMVKMGVRYGYINETGYLVIQPQYAEAHDYGENGIAYVLPYVENAPWCYIDAEGNEVDPKDYQDTGDKNKLTRSWENGKYGYTTGTGEIAIAAVYNYATHFYDDGYAIVKKDGKTYIMDTTGGLVETVPCDEIMPRVY